MQTGWQTRRLGQQTAKGGSEWQTFCLSAIHNRLIQGSQLDPKYMWPKNCSGSQGPCGSQTYNSIVQLGNNAVGVFYQLGYNGPAASVWMMRVDVRAS